MAIRIPVKLNEKVKRIATKERRTRIDQLSIFLELGIAEYERQQKFVQDVSAGKTQIDAAAFAGAGNEARK